MRWRIGLRLLWDGLYIMRMACCVACWFWAAYRDTPLQLLVFIYSARFSYRADALRQKLITQSWFNTNTNQIVHLILL